MAIKFTQKLVLFSNTINNYTETYHQLHAQFNSVKRGKSLIHTFKEIQVISTKIRNLQTSFTEQFDEKKHKLSSDWKDFGYTLEAYIEAVVDHTYVVDELWNDLNSGSLFKRLFNLRKTTRIFTRFDNATKNCIEKGEALNVLINTGKYKT